MINPFSSERRIAVTVTLLLMMAVGGVYSAIVVTVYFSGSLSSDDVDSENIFLEEPIINLLSPFDHSGSTDAATATASNNVGLDIATMSGKELFTMVCAMCHGAEGHSTPIPLTRVPTLNHPDSLAMMSDDYLRHIIAKGRSGSPMAPMGELLSPQGVDKVVAFIRSWEAKGVDPTTVLAINGKVLAGREYFRSNCASCHGINGEGGVGVALNTPAVLGQVTDHYLVKTIINGTPGTAMASWKHLELQPLNDLLAYLRSWQGDIPIPDQDVPNRVVDVRYTDKDDNGETIYSEQSDRALHVGKTQYELYCVECHGVEGKPDMNNPMRFAPTLNNKEFLEAASDGFILANIARGRSHTPMRSFGVDTPGNKALGAQSMRDIVAYMRSWKPADNNN